MIAWILKRVITWAMPKDYAIMVTYPSECMSPMHEEFQDAYLAADRTRLPSLYLQDSHIITIRKAVGPKVVMVGGMIVNTCISSFRTRQLSHGAYKPEPGDGEVNGWWVRPSVPARARLGFLLTLVYLVVTVRIPRFAYSYEIHKKGQAKFFHLLPRTVLFAGMVPQVRGMRGMQEESVELVRTKALLLKAPWIVLQWWLLMRKRKR